MTDLYLSIVTSPLFVAALLMGVVFLILVNIPKPQERRLNPGLWLRRNYWKGMLALGLALGAFAGIFYLFEIAQSVAGMVDLLRETASGENPDAEDLRNLATGVAVLLGALAAAATLIFQLVRVWISERTTTAAEEGLITDRINKAVEGLGAEKTVSFRGRVIQWKNDGEIRDGFIQRWGEGPDIKNRLPDHWKTVSEDEIDQHVSFGDWEDVSETRPNLEVRIGAIYALERIAQDSHRDHIQIMEILCAYIRENSKATPPEDFPLGDWELLADDACEEERADHAKRRKERFGTSVVTSAAWRWARTLSKPRADIGAALEVIGRRAAVQIVLERSADVRNSKVGYRLDLRGAKLQSIDLTGLNFSNAILSEARLEGAHLGEARLEGANLGEARLDDSTDFRPATLRGAGLKSVDLTITTTSDAFLEAFGDGSVTLPADLEAGKPPLEHWDTEDLDWFEFQSRWRAWQREIGYTPPEY